MVLTQPYATLIFTVAGGIFSLLLARKTKLPSIIFLLVFGVAMGPSFLGVVQPVIFRHNFPFYISLMVALILFEGAAQLRVAQYREISVTLKRLLTVGVVVTLLATSILARSIAGFPWHKAILFGSILIVTGPTVVLPILQRVRIKENVHNILKWEAILIDPLGVIIAIVLFEWVLSSGAAWTDGVAHFIFRIALGLVLGYVSGFVMWQGLIRRWLFRFEGEEIGGLYVLAVNLLFFGISEWIMSESGLVTVTVAGFLLGNKKFPFKDAVLRFKEQVTLLALSVLFILISSNVPFAAIKTIWREALLILLGLVFCVRPLSVFLSTLTSKSNFTFKEKLFLAFMAPRGIVSASLASLFAIEFEERAFRGQGTFLPLAFFVIAGTIVFYSTASWVLAKILRVTEKDPNRTVIIGVNALTLLLGQELRKRNLDCVYIDTNPLSLAKARRKGFAAFEGSAFDTEFLESLDLKGIGQAISFTPNIELNILCCQVFSQYVGKRHVYRLWDAKSDQWESVTSDHFDSTGGWPIPGLGNQPGLDALEIAEWGRYRVQKRILTSSLKITPENLKTESIGFALFFVVNGTVGFIYPGVTIPANAEIVYLNPENH